MAQALVPGVHVGMSLNPTCCIAAAICRVALLPPSIFLRRMKRGSYQVAHLHEVAQAQVRDGVAIRFPPCRMAASAPCPSRHHRARSAGRSAPCSPRSLFMPSRRRRARWLGGIAHQGHLVLMGPGAQRMMARLLCGLRNTARPGPAGIGMASAKCAWKKRIKSRSSVMVPKGTRPHAA